MYRFMPKMLATPLAVLILFVGGAKAETPQQRDARDRQEENRRHAQEDNQRRQQEENQRRIQEDNQRRQMEDNRRRQEQEENHRRDVQTRLMELEKQRQLSGPAAFPNTNRQWENGTTLYHPDHNTTRSTQGGSAYQHLPPGFFQEENQRRLQEETQRRLQENLHRLQEENQRRLQENLHRLQEENQRRIQEDNQRRQMEDNRRRQEQEENHRRDVQTRLKELEQQRQLSGPAAFPTTNRQWENGTTLYHPDHNTTRPTQGGSAYQHVAPGYFQNR